MSAKDYLRQIKKDRESIRRLRSRKKELSINYNAIRGMDYSADKVQSSPKNTLEEQGWKLLEAMQEIDRDIAEKSISVDEKLDEIERLNDDRYVQILFMMYSEYKDLKTVSLDMNYDYHYCCQLHGDALKNFEKSYLD